MGMSMVVTAVHCHRMFVTMVAAFLRVIVLMNVIMTAAFMRGCGFAMVTGSTVLMVMVMATGLSMLMVMPMVVFMTAAATVTVGVIMFMVMRVIVAFTS